MRLTRNSYYGCQGLFQNYINNRPNGADGAPGLGLGHQGATGLNLFFQWFCYGMLRSRPLPYDALLIHLFSHANPWCHHR
jgi:hypothetical protein